MLPRSGDILRLTREASVQFVEPIWFRVIRCHDWPTYEGWVWLDGYQLDSMGDAVERRDVFVQIAGLKMVAPQHDPVARRAKTNRGLWAVPSSQPNQGRTASAQPNQARPAPARGPRRR